MRLNQSRMQTYHLKKLIPKKTKEGSSYTTYGDPFAFRAEIWPASGKVQAEMYGEKMAYIFNMLCKPLDMKENDGICVYNSADMDPDYRVISIKYFYDRRNPHLLCELEKLR